MSGDLAEVTGWVHLEDLQPILQDPAQGAPFSGKPALALWSELVAFLIALYLLIRLTCNSLPPRPVPTRAPCPPWSFGKAEAVPCYSLYP